LLKTKYIWHGNAADKRRKNGLVKDIRDAAMGRLQIEHGWTESLKTYDMHQGKVADKRWECGIVEDIRYAAGEGCRLKMKG